MPRKILLFVSTATLLSLVSVSVASSVATAATFPVNFPGTVTCSPSDGVWNGTIAFSPPLMNGGTANTETMIVKASLGNTGSPCVTSAGTIALGSITGTLTFNIAGSANNCATVFSGTALPAPTPGKFKLTWTVPAGGNPTKWTQAPPFVVTGAVTNSKIVVKNAKVTGSYAFPAPKASLSDANWPGASGAVATGCASSTGLSTLTLATSTGKW